MEAWMRIITIRLTSDKFKKEIVFTNDPKINKNESLKMQCSIYKYMSTLKDSATIKLTNLTPAEVIQLIDGEYYNIEIWAGYRSSSVNKIFDGGVLWMSNQLNSTDRTTTLVILAASQLIAKYGQKRLNLTLNSGINLYSAIKFICKASGIPNSNVSTQLKKKFIDQLFTVNNNAASVIDKICQNNDSIISNSDSILEQNFSIFDAALSNHRVIKIDNRQIVLMGGYPRLTNEGLTLTLFPTFNFVCGDTIQIDNSILDISVTNRNEISKNYAAYFNEKGTYMITEMHYELNNRSNNFILNLTCKNRDAISKLAGVKSYE